jgi:NitT/TauT family transport system permease protein
MRLSAIRILIVLLTIACLEYTIYQGWINPLLLPPPSEIFSSIIQLMLTKKFWWNLWVTTSEVLVASAISIPLGIIAGLLLAKHVLFGKLFGPFVYFLVSVPKSIFLPLFILMLGVDFDQKVIFGIFQAFFVIAINTAAATANVPKAWVILGRSCGANIYQLYTKIYVPAMLPMVLEGVRLGVIFIITGVILAEMYAARAGLGFIITNWADTFNMPYLLAGITIAAVLSIFINESIRWYEKKVSFWRG